MAPKSALLTSGTDNLQKKTAPKNPMTTKEKLAAIAAKKENTKILPREPPEKTKLKPKSLPPPGEAFRVTKPKPAAKKSTRPVKPITTKEKQRASEAAKKAKGGVQPKKQENEPGKEGGKTKVKAKMTKGQEWMSVLGSHNPSTYHLSPQFAKESVLMRPTEKAKWFQKRLGQTLNRTLSNTAGDISGGLAGGAENRDEESPFRIMDLPIEIRAMIWKLCIVYPEYFVCPGLPTGREQPDLAMVSRKLRAEVLPIYYKENIFSVELEELNSRLKGIPTIAKWSAQLETGGWFGMIRKWAFDYTPVMLRKSPFHNGEDKNLVVAVSFVKCDNGSWTVDTGAVQVHHDAQCILPGRDEYNQCIIKTSPKWLHNFVERVTYAAKGRDIDGDMIIKLAKAIKANADRLADVRCNKTTVYSI